MDNGQTGAILRSVRKRRGLTQMALANKMGVAKSEVSRLENGKRDHLDFAKLEQWCQALDVSAELVLLDGLHAEASGLTELLAASAPEEAAIARDVLATLPRMGGEARRSLLGMLAAFRKSPVRDKP